MRSTRNQDNEQPKDEDVIEAVEAVVAYNQGMPSSISRYAGASASRVADKLGLRGHKRGGNGAVKGSWSGYMANALRVSPTLRRLAREGRLEEGDSYDRRRLEYWPKDA